MPFIKRTNSRHSQSSADPRKIFIGRTNELHFFREHILKPEDPLYNIISVSGNGGVGKSTLLARFIDEARSPYFKEYCLTAFVDDRQLTPYTLMEKFAQQFNEAGFPLHEFDKALIRYKEAIHKLQVERETAQDVAWREVVDLAGTITAGIVPVVGESLYKAFNIATELYVKEHRSRQQFKDAMLLEDSISDLTRAFVDGLNQLAEEQITLSFDRTKHMRRVLLFFDTFERLAAEIAPWLLDYLLLATISSNVVLLVAGRDSIEHSTPDDPKQWLPLRDEDNIHFINLDSFTWDETRTYLATRGINDPTYVDTIWQQSSYTNTSQEWQISLS